jgi:hypothetical protein
MRMLQAEDRPVKNLPNRVDLAQAVNLGTFW